MIIKVLGILDIISAVLFWIFASFNIIPTTIITIVAFYLLIKGVMFVMSKDIISILDILIAGVIFLSLTYTIPLVIVVIISLFLLQKGVLSLLS